MRPPVFVRRGDLQRRVDAVQALCPAGDLQVLESARGRKSAAFLSVDERLLLMRLEKDLRRHT